MRGIDQFAEATKVAEVNRTETARINAEGRVREREHELALAQESSKLHSLALQVGSEQKKSAKTMNRSQPDRHMLEKGKKS